MMPTLQRPPTWRTRNSAARIEGFSGGQSLVVSLNLLTPSLAGGDEPPRVNRPFERLIAARQ